MEGFNKGQSLPCGNGGRAFIIPPQAMNVSENVAGKVKNSSPPGVRGVGKDSNKVMVFRPPW